MKREERLVALLEGDAIRDSRKLWVFVRHCREPSLLPHLDVGVVVDAVLGLVEEVEHFLRVLLEFELLLLVGLSHVESFEELAVGVPGVGELSEIGVDLGLAVQQLEAKLIGVAGLEGEADVVQGHGVGFEREEDG